MTTTRRLPALLVTAAALALTTSGCSSDPDRNGTAGGGVDTTPEADVVTYEGTAPEDLVTCLDEGGVTAALSEARPFGVEAPVAGVEAGSATLWVFETASEAEQNRSVITLADEDTPLQRLVGNVVVTYAEPEPALARQVDACLT